MILPVVCLQLTTRIHVWIVEDASKNINWGCSSASRCDCLIQPSELLSESTWTWIWICRLESVLRF